jgi:hypothetical protein
MAASALASSSRQRGHDGTGHYADGACSGDRIQPTPAIPSHKHHLVRRRYVAIEATEFCTRESGNTMGKPPHYTRILVLRSMVRWVACIGLGTHGEIRRCACWVHWVPRPSASPFPVCNEFNSVIRYRKWLWERIAVTLAGLYPSYRDEAANRETQELRLHDIPG